MNIEQDLFKRSTLIPDKLLSFGFVKEGNIYKYSTKIMNDKFRVDIEVNEDVIHGKIYDLSTNDEYTNFRIEDFGAFSNTVREKYIEVLKNIRNNCFVSKYFIGSQSNRIANMIVKNFNCEPEFLWEKNPGYGVFRNTPSDKWFAIIMNIDKSKVVSKSSGEVEVINVKSDDNTEIYLKKKGIYPAYHMNKKSWITIILDDTLSDEEILNIISASYDLFPAPNTWVIPANPKYYDLISDFAKSDIMLWHQNINVSKNDTVYIYVAEPYSAILYKCVVIEANIPDGDKMLMKLKLKKEYLKEEYPFTKLKEYGLTAIRGPRTMPNKLAKVLAEEK